MKFGNCLCAILILATSGCSSRLQSLEKMCRESARIEIHDPAAWSAYLAAVTAVDLRTQQSIAHDRLTGPSSFPPDLQAYIKPFPYVEGYDSVDHLQRGSDDKPHAKFMQVMQAGKAIVTVHDFGIDMDNFGYTDHPTCSRDYPEVFGLRRTIVDHY